MVELINNSTNSNLNQAAINAKSVLENITNQLMHALAERNLDTVKISDLEEKQALAEVDYRTALEGSFNESSNISSRHIQQLYDLMGQLIVTKNINKKDHKEKSSYENQIPDDIKSFAEQLLNLSALVS